MNPMDLTRLRIIEQEQRELLARITKLKQEEDAIRERNLPRWIRNRPVAETLPTKAWRPLTAPVDPPANPEWPLAKAPAIPKETPEQAKERAIRRSRYFQPGRD